MELTTTRVLHLWQRYREGEQLTASDLATLKQALEHRATRRNLVLSMRLEADICEGLSLMDVPTTPSKPNSISSQPAGPLSIQSKSTNRWRWVASVAALVFISILLLYIAEAFKPSPRSSIGSIARMEGQVELIRGQLRSTASLGDMVREGDLLITSAQSSIDLLAHDGSTYWIAPKSKVQWPIGHGASGIISLVGGGLFADVQPQSRDFKVQTQKLTVTVLGTRFFLDASGSEHSVHLYEGHVRIKASDDNGNSRDLHEGFSLFQKNGEWTQLPLEAQQESGHLVSTDHSGSWLLALSDQSSITLRWPLSTNAPDQIDVHPQASFQKGELVSVIFEKGMNRIVQLRQLQPSIQP